MRRRFLNVLAALSRLLCIATVVLWVRSYSGADSISRMQVLRVDSDSSDALIDEIQWSRGQMRLMLREQTLYFGSSTPGMGVIPPPHWSFFRYGLGYWGEHAPPPPSVWNRLGFGTLRRVRV